MLSSGVILATAQLDGGLAQGVGGIIVGLFLVPFIADGGRNFVLVVLPPALLFALSCGLRASVPELLRGLLLYGSGIAVAYVQMRMALSMRAHALKVEARLVADATHDALTGCHNRAWLSQAAARAFGAARRYRTEVVFAMLDIDHFKRVNDCWGHGAGDEVLKAVARACQGELRETDHFGRLGGEEFFCIFPNTGRAAALQCAERIRLAVAATQVPVDGNVISVTISIGLSGMTASHAGWENMLAEADQALYAAKSAGRNCIR
jgi:diguanylate cyclase (GGDEF)-like protein